VRATAVRWLDPDVTDAVDGDVTALPVRLREIATRSLDPGVTDAADVVVRGSAG
jgi:hypothetical protein